MKLKPHQILSSNQITAALEEQNKVLFCGACAIGKTVIVLSLVKKWVQEGKRVAISTYSKSDIRNHWLTELKDKFSSLFPNTQVITSVNDLKLQWKKGNPAVSSKRASKTIPLTIFIPQSVRGNLGKFDIIVVDEAHEYLDVKNSKGTLKDIIRKHRHSKTKILGLSATGFDLIKKGMYFEKSKKVIYDVPTALYQNIITNCTAAIRHFDILFSKKHFNSIGDLNSRGIRFWANQFGVKKILLLEKLETVLKELKGKTLIIVPGGIDPKTNMGKETEVCQFLNETFGKGKKVAIAKSSRYSLEEQEKNENEFRTNPRIKFMIVIGMCGTGWDYPGLTNVVDLTFTSNPKLIIHRMSRTTRKFPGKQKGFYVYCADQSKKDGKSVYYLTRALELMTEKGIRDYDGKVWRNFVTEEKKRTRFSIKDYFNIDKKFLKIKNRTLLRMSLMDIRNRTSVDNTLAPFLMVFKEKRKADYAELIKKLRTLKTGYDNNPIFIRKVLKFFKKEYLTIYNLAY